MKLAVELAVKTRKERARKSIEVRLDAERERS